MRGLALIPALQLIDVAATLRQVRRWRKDPATRPSQGRLWSRHILLSLILPNGLTALTLVPMLSKLGGFLRVFMPDFAWVAMIHGSLALVWAFLRTRLLIKNARARSIQAKDSF